MNQVMKTLVLILSLSLSLLAQTVNPKPAPVHPLPHPHPNINPISFKQGVVGQLFSVTLPALSGETGCGLQVFGTQAAAGWKLSGQLFSGTPTIAGFYRLKISCTTPNSVNQVIMLRVDKTAPVPPKPVPAPPVIPLN